MNLIETSRGWKKSFSGVVNIPSSINEFHHRKTAVRPTIYSEGWVSRYEVRRGQDLMIECEVLGVPPPAIIWRFNWGCLPQSARIRVESVSSRFGCTGSRSRLTIRNVQEGDDGIYNCEALTGVDRALSQDIFVILID